MGGGGQSRGRHDSDGREWVGLGSTDFWRLLIIGWTSDLNARNISSSLWMANEMPLQVGEWENTNMNAWLVEQQLPST